MLTKLILRNIQGQKRLVVRLERITVFVGPTDVGKSTIIRALRWACLNSPAGLWMVRHGQPAGRVVVDVDGHRVIRRRGKAVNEYTLDGGRFVSFGSTVPEPIANLLHVGPVNFQSQHEPAFWFWSTPGEVARELNRIVNLEQIDTALGRVGRMRNDARADVGHIRGRLKVARGRRKELDWVFTADRALKRLEGRLGALTAVSTQHGRLTALIEDVQTTGERTETLKAAVLGAVPVVQMAGRIERAGAKLTALRELIDPIPALRRIVNRPRPDIGPLEEMVRSIAETVGMHERLCLIILEIKYTQREIKRWRSEAAQARKLLPKRCPVCGKETKPTGT